MNHLPSTEDLKNSDQTVRKFYPKVLVINFLPTDPGMGGMGLVDMMGWNKVDALTAGFIRDMRYSSYGIANYQVVGWIEVDEFPLKQDGFRYDMKGYRRAYQSAHGWHTPDLVHYEGIISQFSLVERINRREIDEVWLFGFPYAGFYESRMAGPRAFFCNAPPLEQFKHCLRRFVIMGFNYERGIGEMLESMGHRAESILQHVFRGRSGPENLWQRFCRIEPTHPGMSEVGTIHFAPNSRRDYDWANPQPVFNFSHHWRSFPNLEGDGKWIDCTAWGRGDIRQHHLWWFRHIPHHPGFSGGLSNNWWEYILEPDRVG